MSSPTTRGVVECTPELARSTECLAGVTEEYEESYGLTPRTNLFGTTFFTLTGFHGAHVTVGVIWLFSIMPDTPVLGGTEG